MKPFPWVTAHTGCMGMPEHSEESLHAALALGADIYEDDIRVTRDGMLVLAHDDEVVLADGNHGSISSLTLDELNAGLLQPIPLLEPMLRQIGAAGKTMNLDIKMPASLEPVFQMLTRLQMTDQAFLSGCEYEVAMEANRYGNNVPKLLNVNVDSFRTLDYAEAVKQACHEARSADCFGLNMPYVLIRPELMETAEREQLKVYAWTVTDASDMARLAGLGVASITTRNVAGLMAVKAQWNEAKEKRD